jgi:tetratricopeptide (TPR) repeat protein
MKRQRVRFVAPVSATVALSLLLVSCAGNPQKAKLKYLQKGEAYMKQSQFSSAAIEFRNALKVDPRYVEAYYQLARADMGLAEEDGARQRKDSALQDLRDAFKALNQAITVDPNRVDVRIARAELLSSSPGVKDQVQAAADANYVLQQDPKNADAHRVLGTTLFEQKQYDQAIQEFSRAASLAPSNPNSYLGIAQTNLALHHPDDAELNFKKAIQVNSHFIQAYMELAGMYAQQNHVDQAEQIVQQGIQANPSVTGLYEALAQYEVQHESPAQAEQTLQAGIKANPSAIPLYLDLAGVFEGQGKQADAENTLGSLSGQLPKSADAALGIGDFYVRAKMTDRAVAEYQRGLSLDPHNLNIEEHLEILYLSTGRADLAANVDGDLLKQYPNDVLVRVNHGRVLMAQGKVQDAIQSLQKVAADAADSAQAHYYLAMAYLQSNDMAQANGELQQALRAEPGLPDALRALVDLNLRQQKYTVAQLYAQELDNEEHHANPATHLVLGEILLGLEQVSQAADQFTTAEKLAPNSPLVHARLGSLYAAEKRFPEAETEFKSAVQAAPKDAGILGEYASFLISQKQEPKASAMVQQFLAQNPNDADAHLIMAKIHEIEKNNSTALSETQTAVKLKPTVDEYMEMGKIYRNLGNKDAAMQAYDQAIALGPPSAPLVAVVGQIYLGEGDTTKAISEFQRALSIDPNFAVAANNLAWIYAEQGQNLDIALGLAQKAKSEQPDLPDFSDTLAWVMFRRGEYAQALPLLQDCVKKVPDSAQFHYHLGMVLVADGQKSEGRAQLQAALQMKLDSQDAEQARKALSQ